MIQPIYSILKNKDILLFILSLGCGLGMTAQESRDTTYINIGGAVRFNTMYTIYEGETFDLPTENRNGLFWDTFRFEANGETNGIELNFEYRFYPGFNTHFLKKGYFGYEFDDGSEVQLGVTQVPFGMLEFLGNSWWFQLPYYVGLEDDYDTGIKYRFQRGDWTFNAAYFLMAEPRGVSEPDFGSFMSARYSYDVIPEDGYNGNKERNQLNLRAEYDNDNFLVGASGQLGEIYNSNTKNSSLHYAAAIHAKFSVAPNMDVKLQATHYAYPDITADSGTNVNYINMGAYGFGTYRVASEASIFSVGLSWTKEVNLGPIDEIVFYEDYSYMHKYGVFREDGVDKPFVASQHNVLGFLVKAGNIYTYFDIASGINQPWLSNSFGGSALSSGRGVDVANAPGPSAEDPNEVNRLDESPTVNTRFNINLGYYF